MEKSLLKNMKVSQNIKHRIAIWLHNVSLEIYWRTKAYVYKVY